MLHAKPKQQKPARTFRRLPLLLCNIVLIIAALLSAFLYTGSFRRESNLLQSDTFCNTVESMKQLSENYLLNEKGYVNDWASYIRSQSMTMDEALAYLRAANTQTDRFAHIVNMNDLSARSSQFSGGTDWVHCYEFFTQNDTAGNRALIRKMRRIFDSENETYVLGKYRVGETQQTVISVGARVYITNEDGSTEPYLLLRVIPVDYLKKSWVFPTDYSSAEIGIITTGGEYVVQSISMRSRSFLDYIRAYNFPDDYNKVDELADTLQNQTSGLLRYKNFRGEDCYWYFSNFGEDSDLDILGYIPAEQLDSVHMNWSIVFIVCGTLLLLILIDGSYILSINRQLHRAVRQAERASRAKTEFLSSMSHDIRTPMNAITGMTDIAKKHLDEPQYVSDCLNKVSSAGNHLLALINDILDISKVESGKMLLSLHPCSVQQCADEIADIIRPRAEEKHLSFRVSLHGIAHDGVMADQLRINQVLINLLTNAVKYTPDDGAVTMDIEQHALPDRDDRVRMIFRIADNGIGMTPEFQRTMYSSFVRATDGRIDKIQGSGLGLSITKQLVDLMGGSIDCRSTPGAGTTFTVQLELDTAAQAAPAADRSSDETASDLHGLHLLVAEDNDLNWEIAHTLLSEYGITCDRAENGQECVDMLFSAPTDTYALILMDIQMPIMNGKQATRVIRQHGNPIPIVAMTADAFAEDVRECRELGMNGHIAKPIDMQQVLRTLRQLCRTPNNSQKGNTSR